MKAWLVLSLLSMSCACAQELIKAPGKDASPINQRRAYGNACGPASILNSFQYGSEKWRKVFDSIPGNDSRSRIRHVVTTWGNQASSHLKGRKRWNYKEGVNLLDLNDIANEMRSPHSLPKIEYQVLTRGKRDSYQDLVKHSHKLMAKSLKKGLPPIISIHRANQQVGKKTWWPIRAHFVVITEIPEKLQAPYDHFKIKYIDPYGGFIREGKIEASPGAFTNSPFLTANLPDALIGKSLVKKGEPTTLTLSAIIGSW